MSMVEVFRTSMKSFGKRFAFDSIAIYMLTDVKSCMNFIGLGNGGTQCGRCVGLGKGGECSPVSIESPSI